MLACVITYSCGEDILSTQRWVEHYHQDKWGLSNDAVLYCKLTTSGERDIYNGTLTIVDNDEIIEIPLSLKNNGEEKEISYHISSSEINDLLRKVSPGKRAINEGTHSGMSINDYPWLIGKWEGTNRGTYGNSYLIIYISKKGYFEKRVSGNASSQGSVRIEFLGNDKIKLGVPTYRLDSRNKVFFYIT